VTPWSIRVGIVLALALVLGFVDRAILAKERIRREGAVVYLELAPVDPRSLMQGDYMALRFTLAQELELAGTRAPTGTAGRWPTAPGDGGFGWAAIALDGRGVASLAAPGDPAALRFRYRRRGGHVWLGTNAFFFEEGEAGRYSAARFGEFRLDRETGEAVLVGLADEALQPL
jgi:uncharacterized membrane-anchored protein